jgi:hypothetical protein
MRVAGLALLVACAACGSSRTHDSPPPLRAAAQPWERDPYTQTSTVEIDGKPVGYVVEYQPIPAGVDVQRALPTGSYRIQGLGFEDLGFVTLHGDVCRYVDGGSESIGQWPLDQGLIRFFGNTGHRARLVALEPTPPKSAAPPVAEKAEKKEGGEEKATDGAAPKGAAKKDAGSKKKE